MAYVYGVVATRSCGRVCRCFAVVCCLLAARCMEARALATTHVAKNRAERSEEPDYTRGEKLLLTPHVWSIGPTGASGVLWYKPNSTADARMIQITAISAGSPADGILRKDDVILGVGQTKFESDPRKAMAYAITEAERKENGGQLTLSLWRPTEGKEGESMTATISLPVMGSYSASSPWQCDKTETIVSNACASLVTRGLFRKDSDGNVIQKADVNGTIDAMGLLATGEKQYLPMVEAYIEAIGNQVSSPEDLAEMKSWPLAYMNILLCEYHLLTGNKDALPIIKTIASRIVEGRSGVGTWGHSMRMPGQNFASGYGSMNQIGLTLTISLLLTKKCDVEVKDLDSAVKQSLDFFRYFSEKGSIPYGDHAPGNGLAGNGKSAQAAIMFDLAGERAPATYFTSLTIASYNQLEAGHTGHFFNGLWGPLGAARGGDLAAQSYGRHIRWFTETERRFDGEFTYQPGFSSAEHGKYQNWSTVGSRLLQYCLPRRQLYITGKGGSCVAPITGDALQRVANQGSLLETLDSRPAEFTTEELLAFLGSWSPAVREAAAVNIGKRDEDVVDRLIEMLDSKDRLIRYGACDGLHFAGRGSETAVGALVNRVQEPGDMNLRYFAVKALRIPRAKQGEGEQYRHALGEASRKAGPSLLALVATRRPEDDSMDILYGIIAETLFYGGSANPYVGYYPHGQGLDHVDRRLLVPAVKALLSNRNGRARGMVASVYPYLTEEELTQLWSDIYRATEYQAPSGVMFSTEVRACGLQLMADKGYKEGIMLAMAVYRQQGWGHHKRIPAALSTLAKYGEHIKPYLPELKRSIDEDISINKRKIEQRPKSKFVGKLRDKIAEAEKRWRQLEEAAQKQRELKSLAPYLKE